MKRAFFLTTSALFFSCSAHAQGVDPVARGIAVEALAVAQNPLTPADLTVALEGLTPQEAAAVETSLLNSVLVLQVINPPANIVFQADTISGGVFGLGQGLCTFQLLSNLAFPGLQYRIRNSINGATLINWSNVASALPGGGFPQGQFSVQIELPATPNNGTVILVIDFAPNGDTANISSTTVPIYCGDVDILWGQSIGTDWLSPQYNGLNVYPQDLNTGLATYGVSPSSLPQSCFVCAGYENINLTPAFGVPGQSSLKYPSAGAFEWLRIMSGNTGRSRALVGYCYGGTAIASWQAGGTYMNQLFAICATNAPKAGCIIGIIGNQDAIQGTSTATFQQAKQASFQTIQAAILSPSGAPWNGNQFLLIAGAVAQPYTSGNTAAGNVYSTPANLEQIRQADINLQQQYQTTSVVVDLTDDWGISGYYLDSSGRLVHPRQDGMMQISRQASRKLLGLMGLTATAYGPSLVSAFRASGSPVVSVVGTYGAGSTSVAGYLQIGTSAQGTPTAAELANLFTVTGYPLAYSGSAPYEPSNAYTLSAASITNNAPSAGTFTVSGTLTTTPADTVALTASYQLPWALDGATNQIACGIYDNSNAVGSLVPYGMGLNLGPTRLLSVPSPASILPPNALTAFAETVTTSTSLFFTLTPSTLGGTVSDYVFQARVHGTTPWSITETLSATGSAQTLPVRSLAANTNYDVQVTPGNANGIGPTSSIVTHATSIVGTQTLSVGTPSTVLVGVPVSLSGSFSGYGTQPPISFDSSITGTAGSYVTDASTTVTGTASGNFTTISVSFLSAGIAGPITLRDSDNQSVTASTGTFTVTAPPTYGLPGTQLLQIDSVLSSYADSAFSQPVTSNGGTINYLLDISGNGNNFAAVSPGTLTANWENGVAGITLNGTTQYYASLTSALAAACQGQSLTFAIVWKSTTATTASMILASIGNIIGQCASVGRYSAQESGAFFQNNGARFTVADNSSGANTNTTLIVSIITFDFTAGLTQGVMTLYVNSESPIVTSGVSQSSASAWITALIGAQPSLSGGNPTNFFGGTFGKIIVTNAVASSAQASAAIAALNAVY